MMDSSINTLLQLKDIHQPAAISNWPLAWGWYVLALIPFTCLLLIYFLRKRSILVRRRYALKQWSVILSTYKTDKDVNKALAALSQLLKISLLSKNPRTEVASLHGLSWLSYLDKVSCTQAYTQGCGSVFSSIPYMPAAKVKGINMEAIFNLVKLTIKRCL